MMRQQHSAGIVSSEVAEAINSASRTDDNSGPVETAVKACIPPRCASCCEPVIFSYWSQMDSVDRFKRRHDVQGESNYRSVMESCFVALDGLAFSAGTHISVPLAHVKQIKVTSVAQVRQMSTAELRERLTVVCKTKADALKHDGVTLAHDLDFLYTCDFPDPRFTEELVKFMHELQANSDLKIDLESPRFEVRTPLQDAQAKLRKNHKELKLDPSKLPQLWELQILPDTKRCLPAAENAHASTYKRDNFDVSQVIWNPSESITQARGMTGLTGPDFSFKSNGLTELLLIKVFCGSELDYTCYLGQAVVDTRRRQEQNTPQCFVPLNVACDETTDQSSLRGHHKIRAESGGVSSACLELSLSTFATTEQDHQLNRVYMYSPHDQDSH